MHELTLDFETRSPLDIVEDGFDNYARTAEVLMLGWALDDEEPQLWLPHEGPIPARLATALEDPKVLLIAQNAQFERVIFKHALKMNLPYSRWRDTMILARSWSMPGSLSQTCSILKLSETEKKADGYALIQLFCMPAREKKQDTLFGTVGRFNDWTTHPEQWEKFKSYCLQDVRTERLLWRRLNASPLPDAEWQGWFLDQKMNDIGVPVNRKMVENGLWLATESKRQLMEILKEKTGLENPNSDDQMLKWVTGQGYPWKSMRKEFVQRTIDDKNSPITTLCREVLKLRQQAAQRSYKKLERILQVLGPDDRLRYQFNYGGAARTMRWTGGDVQTQNLPRPIKAVKKDYQKAVDLIIAKDLERIKIEYDSVMGMVTSSLRMMFQAPAGKKMVICDLNAIENRVLGFLARCPAVLEVFKLGRDPYLSFAQYLYNMTYEALEAEYKNGVEDKRQNSKPPVLGGGYGLGGGDLYTNEFGDLVRGGLWGYALNVCGVDMPKPLAHKAIKILRGAWPEVVQYWRDLEEAFKQVTQSGGVIDIGKVTWSKFDQMWFPCKEVVPGTVLRFDRIAIEGGTYAVRIQLPSGRYLHYLNPTVEQEDWVTLVFTDETKLSGKLGSFVETPSGKRAIDLMQRGYTVVTSDGNKKVMKVSEWTRDLLFYDGIEHSATQDEEGKKKHATAKWGRVKTYGGKLTENVVQAFSRDILLNGMILADGMGFEIFGCFHDEQGTLADDDAFGLGVEDLRQCMMASPAWAPTMPLGAEGFETKFYRK